jgi:glutamate-1-semialdehyde 2,1-aminomutase
MDGEKMTDDYLVGGVTSGWNHFRVTGHTRVSRAMGAKIWDKDGNEYIDWIMGWGSLLLGHNPTPIMEAVKASFEVGFGFQYETEKHLELANEICSAVPSAERVRPANSGTEATLHAIRIARHVTGRKKIIKFEGHFHGLNDYLLFGIDNRLELGEINADGSIIPIPGSGGLPVEELSRLVIVLPFNDIDAVTQAFEQEGSDIAGIILEPISLNVGCIRPDDGYLESLREICDRYGSVLIFDEVLTGFRVALGGAQELLGVMPDLTCLGKALGCGMPAAALAGKKEFMDSLTPVGKVEMAGTNTGRYMTVVGTLAAVRELKKSNPYPRLRELNDRFISDCKGLFDTYHVPVYIEGYGGRIGIYMGMEKRPRNFREIRANWNEKFHLACYQEAYEKKKLFGFLLPLTTCPEPVTMSVCHDEEIIAETLNRLEDVLKKIPYK